MMMEPSGQSNDSVLGESRLGFNEPVSEPSGMGMVAVNHQGKPLAEWWERAVAIVIDVIVLYVPKAILAALIVGMAMAGASAFSIGFGIRLALLGLVFMAIDLAYFSILNGSERGQTLGQVMLKIAVRDERTGGPIGYRRAGLRIVVLAPGILLSWIPFIGMLADLYTIVAALSPLWDGERRGFHDKAAGTTVIKVR